MPIVASHPSRKLHGAAIASALALCSIAARPALAQRDAWAVRYEAYGSGSVGRPWTPPGAPRATLGDSGVTAQQVMVQGAIRRIYGRDQQVLVIHGLLARATSLGVPLPDASGPGAVIRDVRALYAVQYDFWWLNSVSDRTTVGVIARPGIFTDGVDVGLDHFRVEGAAFVDRIVSDRTTLGIGLAYGSNFGVAIPVPVLHVVHRRGTRFLLDGFVPQRLTAWWYPRKGLDVGLEAQLFGAQYRLGDPAEQPRRAGQVQFANGTIGPVVRWTVFGKTAVSLEGGMTFVRRLNFARFATGPGEAVVGYGPGNAPWVRAGVVTIW